MKEINFKLKTKLVSAKNEKKKIKIKKGQLTKIICAKISLILQSILEI